MIKKKVTYTDYNGNERTEEHHFHLNKAELTEMELSVDGGLSNYYQKIVDSQSVPELAKIFKELLLKSYGVKTDEGRVFEKSEELSRKFSQSAAYETMYMDLASNTELAAKFANGIIPANFEKEIAKLNANNEGNNA